MNPRRARSGHLRATLRSDGTLAGTTILLNGTELRNVAAVDLRITDDGAQLLVSVGHAVIDYGPPEVVDVSGVPADVAASPTPRTPR